MIFQLKDNIVRSMLNATSKTLIQEKI